MTLQRVSPQDFSPNGTNVYQGFQHDDEDIKNLYKLMDSTGVLSLAGSKRQCVLYGSVDSSGNPNFLTASGLNVSIDGSTKPVILSFANGFDTVLGTKDILMSIASNINNAWTIPASGTYYLYIDRDINTGILSYGYTATPDDYLKIAPASPVLDQNYFNTIDMKMYRYNGSAWEQKLRIFVGKVVTTTSAATITPYNLSSKASNNGAPVGSIQEYAGPTAPDGWLMADGSAVSRTAYSELYALIGTTYGTGDGSTTFNLPNKCGKVGVGLNSSDTDFAKLGNTGGEKTHTLSTDEMPGHNHTAWTDSQGNHNHSGEDGHSGIFQESDSRSSVMTNVGTGSMYTNKWKVFVSTNTTGSHGHNVGIGSTGGGGAHNNMQPYIVVNYIIKY